MCLIKEHNHFQFSFSFMEDIEKVFFGIFSQTVLEKIGMNKKLFESKVVQSKAKETTKKGLYLKIKSLKSEEYKKAENLLQIFEGPTKVYIFFEDEHKLKLTPSRLWTAPNNTMLEQLQKLLGPQNVKLI